VKHRANETVEVKEVKEVKKVKEAKEKSGLGAAFFDIDGTLLPKPSLERRFFWKLHWQRKIPAANYFRWVAEFVRVAPRNIFTAGHASKMYLRGVPAEIVSARGANERNGFAARRLPKFFPAAIQHVWWHALRRDSIVLVSGTLAPLAEIVKSALERELLWRGVEAKVSVIATQLEIREEHWTGRVVGAPMFGEAKAFAIKEFACKHGIELSQCSAYGDSSLDRWMLACVGHPFAVNPPRRLRRIAILRGWQVLSWTPRAVRTVGTERNAEAGFEMDQLKWKDEATQ
jgi:phosphoserine phosphatase